MSNELIGKIDIEAELIGKIEPKLEIIAHIISSGARGLQGLQGEKGEKGDTEIIKSADISYIHNQLIPSMEWLIKHNIGKFPSVTIVDSAGTVVEGDVQIIDINKIIVKFNSAFSGRAFLN